MTQKLVNLQSTEDLLGLRETLHRERLQLEAKIQEVESTLSRRRSGTSEGEARSSEFSRYGSETFTRQLQEHFHRAKQTALRDSSNNKD